MSLELKIAEDAPQTEERAELAPVKRSFENWLSDEWTSTVESMTTEVIVLVSDKSALMTAEDGRLESVSTVLGTAAESTRLVNYSDFMSDSWMPMGGASLRVCVLSEPAGIDEMESVYIAAKKRRMAVLLCWQCSILEGSDHLTFLDCDLRTTSEIAASEGPSRLFDKSIVSVAAAKLARKPGSRGRIHSERTWQCIAKTITSLVSMLGDSEYLRLKEATAVNTRRFGWESLNLGDHSISGDNNLLFHHLELVELHRGWFTEHENGEYRLICDTELSLLLFEKIQTALSPRAAAVSQRPNCFLVDLSEDPVISVKHESTVKLSGSDDDSWISLRYRCESGLEFVLAPMSSAPCMISNTDVSFEKVVSVLIECLSKSKSRMHISDLMVRSMLGKAWTNVRTKCSDRMMKSEEIVGSFISIPQLSILDTLLRLSEMIPLFVKHQTKSLWQMSMMDGFSTEIRGSVVYDQGHWVNLFSMWQFDNERDKIAVFKRGLDRFGFAQNANGENAVDWSFKLGDSELIHCVKKFERAINPKTEMEESMADAHFRWTSASEYFVREYLLKKDSDLGQKCLDLLCGALSEFIRDRGDFTSVDVMGLVWHSTLDARRIIMDQLLESLKRTMNYRCDSSKDLTGWMWAKETVFDHPLWLCRDKMSDEVKVAVSDDDVVFHSSSKKTVMFQKVSDFAKRQCEEHNSPEMKSALRSGIEENPDAWQALCLFKAAKETGLLRQDSVKFGLRPRIPKGRMDSLTEYQQPGDLDLGALYDSKAYLTELLIQAQFVLPQFKQLMKLALRKVGQVEFSPLKEVNQLEVINMDHSRDLKWPHSAGVLDLIQCTVKVQNVSELYDACQKLDRFVQSNPEEMSMVRCDNGFKRLMLEKKKLLEAKEVDGDSKEEENDYLNSYADVRMNIACKSEDGSRAIIGEVRLVLDSLWNAQMKAKELHSLIESLPVYEGASHRLQSELCFKQQLMMTGSDESLLVRPLTFYPFLFTLDHIDFARLLKQDFKDDHIICSLASAIVQRSNSFRPSAVKQAIIEGFNAFSDHRNCFGIGSGKLIEEIVRQITVLEYEMQSEIVTDHVFKDSVVAFFEEIYRTMTKLGLSMPICLELFVGLSSSVKSSLPFHECLRFGVLDFPAKLSSFVNCYHGFDPNVLNQVGDPGQLLECVFLVSEPNQWADYNEDDESIALQSLEKMVDYLLNSRRQITTHLRWSSLIWSMKPRCWMKLMCVDTEWKNHIWKMIDDEHLTLDGYCDFLESVPFDMRKRIFLQLPLLHELTDYLEKKQHNSDDHSHAAPTKRERKRYLRLFSCSLLSPESILGRPKDVNRKESWLAHPPELLAAWGTLQQLLDYSSDWDPEWFCWFFGSARTIRIREQIWEMTTLQCAKSYDRTWKRSIKGVDSKKLASMVSELLPTPEWPYYKAWVKSGAVKERHARQILSGLCVFLPESCRAARVEHFVEYRRCLPAFMDGYPLMQQLEMINGRSEIVSELLNSQSSMFQFGVVSSSLHPPSSSVAPSHSHSSDVKSRSNKLRMADLLKLDWFDHKVAEEVARVICEEINPGIDYELLLERMTECIVDDHSDYPIQFGLRTGVILNSMIVRSVGGTMMEASPEARVASALSVSGFPGSPMSPASPLSSLSGTAATSLSRRGSLSMSSRGGSISISASGIGDYAPPMIELEEFAIDACVAFYNHLLSKMSEDQRDFLALLELFVDMPLSVKSRIDVSNIVLFAHYDFDGVDKFRESVLDHFEEAVMGLSDNFLLAVIVTAFENMFGPRSSDFFELALECVLQLITPEIASRIDFAWAGEHEKELLRFCERKLETKQWHMLRDHAKNSGI